MKISSILTKIGNFFSSNTVTTFVIAAVAVYIISQVAKTINGLSDMLKKVIPWVALIVAGFITFTVFFKEKEEKKYH